MWVYWLIITLELAEIIKVSLHKYNLPFYLIYFTHHIFIIVSILSVKGTGLF